MSVPAIVVSGWLAAGASTQESARVSTAAVTLPQVLAIARRDNPEIRAALKRWEAGRRRILQEATPGKPRLDIERMSAPAGRGVLSGAEEQAVSVTQELPFPTSLWLRRGRAAAEAQMLEQSYLAKVRQVLAHTRSAYAMLFLAHKGLAIYGENIEIMRRFAKVAESKYVAGHASQSDALKAQVELTKMLNMSVELEQERETTSAMLDALLGREAGPPLGPPREPEPGALRASLEELEVRARADRPELREAALGVRRAEKSLALARSEFLPEFMLQYRWRTDPMRGKTRDGMLGLSVPLWFWKPAALVVEARAEKEAADAELATLRVMTRSGLKTAFVRARTALRLADIYRTSVLPQAEAALTVAEAGYQSEKTSFLDLLDAQRSLLDFKLEYYRYVAESERRLAELERIVGSEL